VNLIITFFVVESWTILKKKSIKAIEYVEIFLKYCYEYDSLSNRQRMAFVFRSFDILHLRSWASSILNPLVCITIFMLSFHVNFGLPLFFFL
ncbi:hypothetical protein L9F63_010147, partial [Diploptera punctata]